MEHIMENVQITMDEYLGLKNDIHENINRIAKSFVRIGETLCKIEQTGAYRLEGYATLPEFAKAEYDMTDSGVSRFVNVYKKFCSNGQLKTEYEKYTYKQLVEMLNLPEEDMALIGPGSSREDIRELKRFNREGKNDTHRLETWQDQKPEEEEHRDLLKELLPAMFQQKSREEEFDRICSEVRTETMTDKEFSEIVNPSGSRTVRKGRVMAFLFDNEVRMKIWGENEPVIFTYTEMLNCFWEVFRETLKETRDWWSHEFVKAAPEEEKTSKKEEAPAAGQPEKNPEPAVMQPREEETAIAPAQKSEEKPKIVEKKERITSAADCEVAGSENINSPDRDQSGDEAEKKTEVSEDPPTQRAEMLKEPEDEQIPGQDSIENHPELLPDGYKAHAKVDGQPVFAEVELTIAQRKEECMSLISIVQGNIKIENYVAAAKHAEKLLEHLRKIGKN